MATYSIDMGHGLPNQPNSGAVGIINESIETRVLGNKVISLLQKQGHKVINCTVDYPKSNSDSINQRINKANAQPSDLFVSIHFNSGGGKGVEILTVNAKYMIEADRVLKGMEKLGFRNRGIKTALTSTGSKVGVVHRTRSKAMLIEVCFVDTQSDVDLYRKNIDKIAEIIVEGITGKAINSSNNKQEIKNIGDDDMISDSVKVFANPNSPIAEQMKEQIKILQGVYKLPQNGIADEKLVKSLLELTGVETRGIVTIMQKILILKGMLSKGSDTGIIGQACRNGIDRFKESVGIPLNTVLVDRQTWRKLLEY